MLHVRLIAHKDAYFKEEFFRRVFASPIGMKLIRARLRCKIVWYALD